MNDSDLDMHCCVVLQDKRVNWHSTPFETRLEKALNRGASSAYVPRVF